jgi:hypothetical protein
VQRQRGTHRHSRTGADTPATVLTEIVERGRERPALSTAKSWSPLVAS